MPTDSLQYGDPCDRCGRTVVGWPLETRGDRCSPKSWRNCIRNPQHLEPPEIGPIDCICGRCGAPAVILPDPEPVGVCLCSVCSTGAPRVGESA